MRALNFLFFICGSSQSRIDESALTASSDSSRRRSDHSRQTLIDSSVTCSPTRIQLCVIANWMMKNALAVSAKTRSQTMRFIRLLTTISRAPIAPNASAISNWVVSISIVVLSSVERPQAVAAIDDRRAAANEGIARRSR